jgi:hypothetical protein
MMMAPNMMAPTGSNNTHNDYPQNVDSLDHSHKEDNDEDDDDIFDDNEQDEEDEDDDDELSPSLLSSSSHQATFGHACGIWFNPTVELIANDLRDLSKGRRELVWSDMIGNDSNAGHFEKGISLESPEICEQSLQELDRELKGMFSFGDTALRRARNQCPSYVDDRDFRLRFLRAERYHVKNAATRLLRHFEEKKFLFGEACLGRDIRLSDLTDDDLECLQVGGQQISPFLDKHGRTIEIVNLQLMMRNPVRSKISEVS